MGLHVGLDIGIASVGWAVLDPDEHRIVDLGVRTFQKAENPKDGSSLALPRRLARSSRRRLSRRRARMSDFRDFLAESGIVASDQLEITFIPAPDEPTPYQLRYEGLDRQLSAREWARVLSQLCKRRGYKSMKLAVDSSGKNDDEGRVKSAIAENAARMTERGYRTFGEMLWLDERFKESRRNRGDYKGVASRNQIIEEIRLLFEAQRSHGNPFAAASLEDRYLEILQQQQVILEGDAIRAKVGKCSIDRVNPRIPAACPTFERFRLVDKLHNVRYTLPGAGTRVPLDKDQRDLVIEKALGRTAKLTYADVRKICALPEQARFVGVRYGSDATDVSAEGKERIPLPRAWHDIRRALSDLPADTWENLSGDIDRLDDIAEVLTYYKYEESVIRELRSLGLSDEVACALSGLRFSGHGHLSRQTLRSILPFMEEGLPYSEACAAAGFHHSQRVHGERQEKLPPIPVEDVRNPVVLRALAQTRKVLNAIIREFGSIEELHIEFGRDVARSHEDRRKIEKAQKENRARNESVLEDIEKEFGITSPRPLDIVKYKLWKEQLHSCVYSGDYIDPARMLSGEPGIAEVDHILPHSRSFDDGFMNKVLATTTENRRKRERTPYEYLGGDPQRWHEFEERVLSMHLPRPKRERLLRADFDERASEEFRERNLNDTRYIARQFKSFVEENLIFVGDRKAPVVTVNGRATAYLRTAWRLQKVRADGDLHHALDAAVIAATNRSMIQQVSRFFSVRPLRNPHGEYIDAATGEIVPAKHVPEPWEGFAGELRERMGARWGTDPFGELQHIDREAPRPILVSRMPSRAVRGEIHKETVRRIEGLDEKGLIRTSKRVRIEDLTPRMLDNMVGRTRDRELHEALAERLAAFGGDGKKAFAEPFYKPSKPGRKAPRVRAVRVYDSPSSGGTEVRGGLADNSTMARTDVFERDGRFYLVPVYLKDTIKDELPMRAIVQGKPESEWREIDDSYRFVFSLHLNDPIRLVRKSGGSSVAIGGYYKGVNRSNACIDIEAHDASWKKQGQGVAMGVESFEKYSIDPLGRTAHLVRQEKRRGFSNGSGKQ